MYIIRSQGSDDVDGALGLLKLEEWREKKDEVGGALGKCGMVFTCMYYDL